MKRIKAIVLSYDKNRAFTDHMILCYEKLWPKHPFVFHVPYQELGPTIQTDQVRYVQSPADIKGTIKALLEGLDDEELIYWCIDDKYPVALDVSAIENIQRHLLHQARSNMSGILFCRCRGMFEKKNLSGKWAFTRSGNLLLERKNYEQIWIHQYLKVKVLRHMFNSFPEQIPKAADMDIYKSQFKKPKEHRLFVTRKNLSVFGESTSKGNITMNCKKSFSAHGLKLPEWATTVVDREIIMGEMPKKIFHRSKK